MMVTDTCVHPYPEGNTTLRRMALEAGELGFDSIVAPVPRESRHSCVRIIPSVIIDEPDVRKVSGQIRSRGKEGVLIMVNARENGFNRAVVNLKGVHILRHLHKTQKNSFDHIAARNAADRRVAIDIDLYPLIHSSGPARQKVLQRYRDIITLWSRYGFPLSLSSNAYSVLDLRSAEEIPLLCSLFGLEETDAREALGTVENLLTRAGPVRVLS
jgi:ribonuclease P/MRP protein subunit RPP1